MKQYSCSIEEVQMDMAVKSEVDDNTEINSIIKGKHSYVLANSYYGYYNDF